MTSPIEKNGTPLSAIFAPYQAGTTKAAATGIKENGVELADLYAKLSYGAAAAATGISAPAGDLNTYFAAINTPSYALGFNGGSYSSFMTRSEASIMLRFNADGTWQVLRNTESNGTGGEVLASGSWLNYGGTAAEYTVKFASQGLTSGPDVGGGTTSLSNGAATPQVMTTAHTIRAGATAVQVGNDASNAGNFIAYLYRNGTLVSQNTCSIDCESTGV